MKRYSISQRKKSRGNLTWYGRTYENGVLVSEISLATKRRSDAQMWLDSMNASKFMPENMFRIKENDRPLKETADKFLDTVCSEKGPNSATYRAYKCIMSSWLSWCDQRSIRTLRAFSREMAVEYSNGVSARYSPHTSRDRIRLLNQFSRWASETFDMEDWTPTKTVHPPKLVKMAKSFWTPEQIDAILNEAPDREFRLFWSLMAFAGLRHAEACSFGKSSLSYCKIRVVGKGNKEAFIPIGDRLGRELHAFGEIEDGMFMKSRFRQSKRSNDVLKKAVSEAGLDDSDATNHKFRHSFASNLLRAKVPVPQTARLMRHEDAKTTLSTYSHLLQEDLQEAVDVL